MNATTFTPAEQLTLQNINAFIQRCGGTVVVAMFEEHAVASSYAVTWKDPAWGPASVDIRECVIRPATLAEWEACRWPGPLINPDNRTLYFYEVGYD